MLRTILVFQSRTNLDLLIRSFDYYRGNSSRGGQSFRGSYRGNAGGGASRGCYNNGRNRGGCGRGRGACHISSSLQHWVRECPKKYDNDQYENKEIIEDVEIVDVKI